MAYPKSMYQMTKDGMTEQHVMSQEEEWALKGWYPHPEEARQHYVPVVVAELSTEPPKKKGGRPRKA